MFLSSIPSLYIYPSRLITMSDIEMNGDSQYELTEEEQADLDAELAEGFEDIEAKCVFQ